MGSGEKVYLAVDLGASSGRVVAGRFDGTTLTLEDVHRFENNGIMLADRLQWDLPALWNHIVEGLRAAASTYGEQIVSVGVDTWGVDFALLGRNDELLANPYHYRDSRTNGIVEEAFSVVSRDEIFAETGLQFMQINTLYQLWAMRRHNSSLLDVAESFLMMPDLIHWLLTGEKGNEYTNATTSQCLNAKTRTWSKSLLEQFDIPTDIFGTVLQPGTNLGQLRKSVAEATGLHNVNVVLPGTHDTASAVMAVPAEGETGTHPNWCYISSGTWSLMGTEVAEPVINSKCSELNFTNEGGIGGTVRLLKNIAGLWLVQQCRQTWETEGKNRNWEQLVQAAEAAAPLTSHIAPDHEDFMAPSSMPEAIASFCERTGQSIPSDEGATVRCALESLALRYRMVLEWSEQLLESNLETIHIVGGGVQNKLLCQMAADACNRRVVSGPVEATAIGNIMMQAVSAGDVASIREARQVVTNSFEVDEYIPQTPDRWDSVYERFVRLNQDDD